MLGRQYFNDFNELKKIIGRPLLSGKLAVLLPASNIYPVFTQIGNLLEMRCLMSLSRDREMQNFKRMSGIQNK
jgi:hypothetical protein